MEQLKKHFNQKTKKFFEHCIMQLLERWRKVIEQDGAYYMDCM